MKYKVTYDEYWRDDRQTNHVDTFDSLEDIEEWIFGQMRTNYTGQENYALSFPRQDKNGDYPSEPTLIRFRPSSESADYTIRMICDDRGIIYSDGKFTCGQKHWTRAVRNWCIRCEERRKHPSFNFVIDNTPADTPSETLHNYVVCYRESCVRDVEVCTKDPAMADPIGSEWTGVDSAMVFAGIYRAVSKEAAAEAAARAEGCDAACLTAILVSE